MIELIEGDCGNTFRSVEIEFNFLLGGKGMDHVRDGADQVDRVEHINRLGTVGHCDRHSVTLTHTDGAQGLRTAVDLLDHALVSGGAAHKVKGDVIGVLIGYFFNSLIHGSFKIVEVRRHIAKMSDPRCFHLFQCHFFISPCLIQLIIILRKQKPVMINGAFDNKAEVFEAY